MDYEKAWKRLRVKASEGKLVPKNPFLIAMEEIEKELAPYPQKATMIIEPHTSVVLRPARILSDHIGLGVIVNKSRVIVMINKIQADILAGFLLNFAKGASFDECCKQAEHSGTFKIEYDE